MRLIRNALAALALLCAGAFSLPALAADNVAVTAGSGKTMACLDISTVCFSKVLLYDTAGAFVPKAEDAAHTSGDFGFAVWSVRKDTAATTAGTDGDYAALTTDANGRLHSIIVAASGAYASGSIASGAIASGAVASGAYASGSIAAGALAAGSGVDGWDLTQGAKADSVCATDTGTCTAIALLKKNNANLTTLNTTLTSDPADGAADSGTSAKLGVKCSTSAPAIETAADRVPVLGDCLGKPVMLPNALPASYVTGLTAAMTGTTSTAVTGIGAPAAGLRNYITTLVCGNSHATVGTFVELQDGSGGTTFFTVPAAAVYGGTALTFPTPLKQPTTATALFVKDTTTGANVICSAAGFTAP